MSQRETSPSPPPTQGTILVVDDAPTDLELLLRHLTAASFEVLTASHGDSALSQADDTRPDLILLDVILPGLDGFETCRRLKAQETTRHIPIIFMTTLTNPADRVRGFELGAVDYVTKPIEPTELVARLTTHLTLRTLQKQLQTQNTQLQQEIAERQRAEETLRAIVEGTAAATGSGFFAALVRSLTTALGVRYAFVGELSRQARIKTLAFWAETNLVTNFEYNLAGTPCETVVNKEMCYYPHRVWERFPEDKALAERQIECYLGAPLFDSIGQPLGLLTVMHDQIMEEALEAKSILSIFAARAGVELERLRTEDVLRQRNRELTLLNRVIAAAGDGVPETMLTTACRELALTFELPLAAVALLDEHKTEATVVAEYLTSGRPSILNETISLADNQAAHFILTHKMPLVAADAQHDPRLASVHDLLRRWGAVSLLMLPLLDQGEIIGGLGLSTNEPRHFSAAEIGLAWNVAGQVAGALARVQLDQERRRLSAAIEQAAESVVITDTAGNILYVNPAFERITGYRRAEVLGHNPRLLKSDQQPPAFYEEMWATLTAGRTWHGRMINKKKDGDFYTEEATISPVLDENRTIVSYVALKRDVTRELALEAQYRQAQKMEAIGQLAGGIAHDFNNLLTALMGHAALALDALTADHPARSDLAGIEKTARRAADLTRQLLTFARSQIIEPRILDLNELILKMDNMLRRLIRADIELVSYLAPNLGAVKADASQIEQVVVNLVVNARDAMPDGGKLTIETANVNLEQTDVADHAAVTPGDYVLLAVSDTGHGMTETIKVHIFEPFFTTKEVGQGSGLGLATCFGIVKQNGGHIWVYSEPGQGTSFKVYLPRVTDNVERLSEPDRRAGLPRGIETILLVEDEIAVRDLASRVLRQQGYTVLTAGNGEEAMALAQAQPDLEIQLLLTDMIMPRLNGQVLAQQLQATRPTLKSLFISGYTDQGVIHNRLLTPGVMFLPKPFTPELLARKVREVLDSGPR